MSVWKCMPPPNIRISTLPLCGICLQYYTRKVSDIKLLKIQYKCQYCLACFSIQKTFLTGHLKHVFSRLSPTAGSYFDSYMSLAQKSLRRSRYFLVCPVVKKDRSFVCKYKRTGKVKTIATKPLQCSHCPKAITTNPLKSDVVFSDLDMFIRSDY